ncbi:MAG: SDR family NAD(P)-dependent oxidoreductase, partial [Roseinatronobacter sp.]
MEIAGHLALVTGGGSGLGAATARHLAARGAEVAILDFDIERAHQVAAEIGAQAYQVDVGDAQAVGEAVAQAVAQAHGRLRMAVNCAGIANAARVVGRDGTPSTALFERVIRVNL